MDLRKKLKTKVRINTTEEASMFAEQCETICDDFAIGFAYWITDSRNENVKGSISIEELLQIYKDIQK